MLGYPRPTFSIPGPNSALPASSEEEPYAVVLPVTHLPGGPLASAVPTATH